MVPPRAPFRGSRHGGRTASVESRSPRRSTTLRLRRSCLAVPGSSEKMLQKAATLPADQVFLDLEDAVSPLEKEASRATVVSALNMYDYSGKTRVVRVNGVTTRWCLGDIVEVVSGAGRNLDCLMIPKVEDASQLHF